MEASEALGGGQAAADTGETGGEQQAPDIQQAMADRFGALEQSFADRFDGLQESLDQRLASQEPQGGYEQGGDDLFLDEQTGQIVDAQGRPVDPAGLGQQEQGIDPRVIQGLQQQMQSQLQETIAPILEHFQDQQAADLEERYPDFRDEKYAKEMVDAAEERAAAFGNPELARNVGFIELLHLAKVGAGRGTGQETPAGASETGVALETGGVSHAGQNEVDPGDRIVRAATGRSSFFS